ncbi:CotD family spore coat protein [Virgibacillus sp. MG-45]|uniref:CotD family spore coat protein n=1 Tax=Virgibacillus sp. MG-45 TaxID=3102791 RepID=UPI002ED85505
MRHHHGCPKQIVYPVKQYCVQHCTESEVEHVHPSHTTVMNHHLIKNKHVFPYSTSVQNTVDSVDIYGGTFPVPYPPRPTPGVTPSQVAGAMQPGMPPGQVAGVMQPGMGPGMPPGQVAGAMQPGMPHWKQKNKWC